MIYSSSPSEEKVNLYLSLFRGRSDVIAVRDERVGIFHPMRDRDRNDIPPARAHFIRHFNGHLFLGLYPLLKDNTTFLVAVDLDGKSPRQDPLKEALALLQAADDFQIPFYLERSQSGKGYHVWGFFDAAIAAWKTRLVVLALLQEAGCLPDEFSDPAKLSSFDRIFPNQEKLTGRGYGNLIALPLQGNRVPQGNTVFLIPEMTVPYPDQWQFLSQVQRIPERQFDLVIAEWDLTREAPKEETASPALVEDPAPFTHPVKGNPPCLDRLPIVPKSGYGHDAALVLAIHYTKNRQLPPDLAVEAILSKFSHFPEGKESERRKIEVLVNGLSSQFSNGCRHPQTKLNQVLRKHQEATGETLCPFATLEEKQQGCPMFQGSIELQYVPDPAPAPKKAELPKFPLEDALPERGFIRKFYDYAVTVTDAPDQFIVVAALLILAASIGRKVYISWFGGSQLFANLYVLLLGDSTLLRKSTVLKLAKQLILETRAFLRLAEQFSWEGLVDEMGYPLNDKGQLLLPQGDHLSPQHKAQKVWFLDEYAAFLQGTAAKSYMADLKLLLTELYGCPPSYRRRLRKDAVEVSFPYLNILGASTMEVFINSLDRDDLRSGFLQRHLLVLATERHRFLARPVTGEKDSWTELGQWLIKKGDFLQELVWSPEADRLFFDEWVTSHENPDAEDTEDMKLLGSYYGRLKDYCAKFAMLYETSLSDGRSETISEEAARRAIALTEYQQKVVRYFLTEGSSGGDPVLQCRDRIFQILSARRDAGKAVTTRREILRGLSGEGLRSEIYEKALRLLQDQGLLQSQWTENRNKTNTYYYWLI